MRTSFANGPGSSCCLAMACIGLCLGCMDQSLDYTELKRIDEKISESELHALMRIGRALQGGELPRFTHVFESFPEWNRSRNLPVSELIDEQTDLLNQRWSIDGMAEHLESDRMLQRALRRERMTLKQFASLTLTVGMALSRSTVRDNQDLDAILRKGQVVVKQLRRDDRPFSSLSTSGMYYISQQARWITRVYRARQLKLVPAENVRLVQKYRDALVPILPRLFALNPFDAIADPLEEHGVPFEELVETGTDDEIKWDPSNANFGTDVPDSAVVTNREEQDNDTTASTTGPKPSRRPGA